MAKRIRTNGLESVITSFLGNHNILKVQEIEFFKFEGNEPFIIELTGLVDENRASTVRLDLSPEDMQFIVEQYEKIKKE